MLPVNLISLEPDFCLLFIADHGRMEVIDDHHQIRLTKTRSTWANLKKSKFSKTLNNLKVVITHKKYEKEKYHSSPITWRTRRKKMIRKKTTFSNLFGFLCFSFFRDSVKFQLSFEKYVFPHHLLSLCSSIDGWGQHMTFDSYDVTRSSRVNVSGTGTARA